MKSTTTRTYVGLIALIPVFWALVSKFWDLTIYDIMAALIPMAGYGRKSFLTAMPSSSDIKTFFVGSLIVGACLCTRESSSDAKRHEASLEPP